MTKQSPLSYSTRQSHFISWQGLLHVQDREHIETFGIFLDSPFNFDKYTLSNKTQKKKK